MGWAMMQDWNPGHGRSLLPPAGGQVADSGEREGLAKAPRHRRSSPLPPALTGRGLMSRVGAPSGAGMRENFLRLILPWRSQATCWSEDLEGSDLRASPARGVCENS